MELEERTVDGDPEDRGSFDGPGDQVKGISGSYKLRFNVNVPVFIFQLHLLQPNVGHPAGSEPGSVKGLEPEFLHGHSESDGSGYDTGE